MNSTSEIERSGPLGGLVCLHLLDQAQEISRRALQRLHRLRERFPADLPAEEVAEVESDDDRQGDRRHSSRALVCVAADVCVVPASGEVVRGLLADLCAGGASVVLPREVSPGSILLIRPTDILEGHGFYAEVRHCRREEGSWVAGCRVMGEEAS
jgi:hypothetical protein